MTVGARGRLRVIVAGGLATALSAWPVLAQEGGLRLTADATLRLEYDSNPDLTSEGSDAETRLSTRLNLGFDSETRTQTLSFALSGEYARANGGSEPGTDFLGPDLSLSYTRLGANADFSLDVDRSERDISDTFSVLSDPTDPLSPDDLVIDTGTLVSTDVSARLRTGIEGPFGFDVGVAAEQQRYQGTTSPDLEDSESTSADIALRFRLSPVVEARLTAEAEEERTDDDVDTVERDYRLGAGLGLALSPAQSLDVSAGIVRIETIETVGGGRITDTTEGVSFALSYSAERPGGSFVASVSQDIFRAGSLIRAEVGQTIELPLGSLDYRIGAGWDEDGDLAPVGQLAYTREGRTSSFTANVAAAIVPDDDDFVSSLSGGIGYRHDVTEALSISLSAELGLTSPLGDSIEPEQRRASFGASVTRELTRDWGLTAGYTGRFSEEEGEDSAWSNGAFIQIGRSFSIRP